jgi:MFS family permease
MQSTSLGWLVIQLTDSPALLGVTSAAGMAPTLLLSLLAGVFADRVDRRRLLVATQLTAAGLSGILALLTTTGGVEFWHIVVLAFLLGSVTALAVPSFQAIVSTIVDRGLLGSAIALNSAQYNLARVFAPSMAGLAIAAGGLAVGFWVNSAAYLVVAAVLASLPIAAPRALAGVQAALWADLADGLRYVAGDRIVALLVLLAAAPALFVLNYLALLPVYARDILAIGAPGLGLLTGAIGVGALAGALTLALSRPAGGSGRIVLGGLAIASASLVVFGVSRSVPLSLVALALIGAFQVAYYSTTNTLIQVLVPARLRGRVLSLYTLTSIGLIPIGNLVAGIVGERFGVPVALSGGGLICLAIAALVLRVEPRLLGLRADHLAGRAEAG